MNSNYVVKVTCISGRAFLSHTESAIDAAAVAAERITSGHHTRVYGRWGEPLFDSATFKPKAGKPLKPCAGRLRQILLQRESYNRRAK